MSLYSAILISIPPMDFLNKELAHMIIEADKSQICKVSRQAGEAVV